MENAKQDGQIDIHQTAQTNTILFFDFVVKNPPRGKADRYFSKLDHNKYR
jgi:hypothetical protein